MRRQALPPLPNPLLARQKIRLPAGDVLLHAGDFTSRGTAEEVRAFADWLRKQPHRLKVTTVPHLGRSCTICSPFSRAGASRPAGNRSGDPAEQAPHRCRARVKGVAFRNPLQRGLKKKANFGAGFRFKGLGWFNPHSKPGAGPACRRPAWSLRSATHDPRC